MVVGVEAEQGRSVAIPRPPSRVPRWLLAALAHLALLGGLLALTDLDASWTFDDGAYATQVKVLDQTGDWAYPYRWADRDPTSRFAPVSHGATTDSGTYPYVKRPVWIGALRASTSVFGPVDGLYVPSVLGAVAAALVAWALAERLRAGWGPVGFWAVALGPLVVHTSAMWAHTWGAALGGVLAVLVADVATGRRARWHLPAVLVVPAALVSIRTEGLLVIVAAAVVLGLLALRRPGWPARCRRVAVTAVPLVAVALVTHRATARWGARLAPGTAFDTNDQILTDLSFAAARWSGFCRTFVSGFGQSPDGAVLAAAAAACSLLGGLVLGRRRGGELVGGGLVAVGLGLLAVRQLGSARFDLGGALLALPPVPVAVGAVVGSAWSRRPSHGGPHGEKAGDGLDRADGGLVPGPATPWVAALVGLHALAIVATQYPEGGSRDWGGRFLFVVIVPASVLAVLALTALVAARRPASMVRAAAAVIVVLVALPTAAGWLSATSVRTAMGGVTDRSEAPTGTTVIRLQRYITRGSWRLLPEQDQLSAEVDTAPAALAMLRPGRSAPVVVVGQGAEDVRAPGYDRRVEDVERVVFTPS